MEFTNQNNQNIPEVIRDFETLSNEITHTTNWVALNETAERYRGGDELIIKEVTLAHFRYVQRELMRLNTKCLELIKKHAGN